MASQYPPPPSRIAAATSARTAANAVTTTGQAATAAPPEAIPLAMQYYVLYCNLNSNNNNNNRMAQEEKESTHTNQTEDFVADPSDSTNTNGESAIFQGVEYLTKAEEEEEEDNEQDEGASSDDGAVAVAVDFLPPPPPWVEDHWTREEEDEARRLLDEHQPKCQSRTPERTNSHGAAPISSSPNATLQTPNAQPVPTGITATTPAKTWNRFYQNHSTHFFKDRHYLSVTFPNEFGGCSGSSGSTDAANTVSSVSSSVLEHHHHQQPAKEHCLVEIGCGVGNTMLPLLEDDPYFHHHTDDNTIDDSTPPNRKRWSKVYGLDVSPVAIALLQQDERYQRAARHGRARAFVCDIAATANHDAPTNAVPPCFVHVATVTSLLFCLSAIDPLYHATAVRNAASTLQQARQQQHSADDAAVLVFRDYGRYDAAHLKLGVQRGKLLWRPPQEWESTTGVTAKSIANNNNNNTNNKSNHAWYRKQDGTMCYYFTVEQVRHLFETEAGLETIECDYIKRVYCNRLTGEERRRVWVQGRFRVPTTKATL